LSTGSPLLGDLIEALRCLPGVGAKSAQRMAFHVLERDRAGARRLAERLALAVERVGNCRRCRGFSEQDTCVFCANPSRDKHLLCVVETPVDQLAIEQATGFCGQYFVLLGRLSPMDGLGPKELGLDLLAARLADDDIELLIHNAGMLVNGEEFGKVEAQALSHTFATNTMGPFLLSQALATQLKDGGKVIAISSGLGSIERTQRFGTPSYDISKAALNMAMRLLGHALSERRIAVLALSPGWVKTDMGGENADLEPAQSIGNMLKVIDALAFDDAAIGQFLGNDGKPIPW